MKTIEFPNATDFEESVLGACLSFGGTMDEVIDILNAECFYTEGNQMIWKALTELYRSNDPIDILSVKRKLEKENNLAKAGGVVRLVELTSRIASASNIEYHARIIVEQYLRRELIKVSNEAVKSALDDTNDVFDTFSKSIAEIESLLNGVIKYEAKQIGKVHQKNLEESRHVAKNKIASGVPTGYRNLDNFINGWQKTDLIILAGRPAMGKSVCALSFVLNPALKDNIPTALFSLEMSNEQLVGRAESNLSLMDSSRIIKKQLTEAEIDLMEQRCQILNTAPIYIDDSPNLTLLDLKGKARKLVKEKGVQLIVIDYLQLMSADSKKNMSREQEVSQISRGLKALAKELKIPIIALSQLNRLVENRTDKRPNLADLRESGSIEQDADMVMFCYRPDYYDIPQYEMGGETLPSEGLMVLIVAKHRAGSLGELRFGFNGDLTKLENYDTFISNKRESQRSQQPAIRPNPNIDPSPSTGDIPF